MSLFRIDHYESNYAYKNNIYIQYSKLSSFEIIHRYENLEPIGLLRYLLDFKNLKGKPIFQHLCYYNHLPVIQWLSKKLSRENFEILIKQSNIDGEIGLYHLVDKGNFEILEWFCKEERELLYDLLKNHLSILFVKNLSRLVPENLARLYLILYNFDKDLFFELFKKKSGNYSPLQWIFQQGDAAVLDAIARIFPENFFDKILTPDLLELAFNYGHKKIFYATKHVMSPEGFTRLMLSDWVVEGKKRNVLMRALFTNVNLNFLKFIFEECYHVVEPLIERAIRENTPMSFFNKENSSSFIIEKYEYLKSVLPKHLFRKILSHSVDNRKNILVKALEYRPPNFRLIVKIKEDDPELFHNLFWSKNSFNFNVTEDLIDANAFITFIKLYNLFQDEVEAQLSNIKINERILLLKKLANDNKFEKFLDFLSKFYSKDSIESHTQHLIESHDNIGDSKNEESSEEELILNIPQNDELLNHSIVCVNKFENIINAIEKEWLSESIVGHEIFRLLCLGNGIWGLNLSLLKKIKSNEFDPVLLKSILDPIANNFKSESSFFNDKLKELLVFLNINCLKNEFKGLCKTLKRCYPDQANFQNIVIESIVINLRKKFSYPFLDFQNVPFKGVLKMILKTKLIEFKKTLLNNSSSSNSSEINAKCYILDKNNDIMIAYPLMIQLNDNTFTRFNIDTVGEAREFLLSKVSNPVLDSFGGVILSDNDFVNLCRSNLSSLNPFYLLSSTFSINSHSVSLNKKRKTHVHETVNSNSNGLSKEENIQPRIKRIRFSVVEDKSSSSLNDNEFQVDNGESIWKNASATIINNWLKKQQSKEYHEASCLSEPLLHPIINNIKSILPIDSIDLVFHNQVLLPYQKEDVAWLLSLNNAGLSGVLASEMGLGKTFTSIEAMFQHFDIQNEGKKLGLIMVPKSLVSQWNENLFGRLFEAKINYFRRALLNRKLDVDLFFEFFEKFLEKVIKDKNLTEKTFKVLKEVCSVYFNNSVKKRLFYLCGKYNAFSERIRSCIYPPEKIETINEHNFKVDQWISKINIFDAISDLEDTSLTIKQLRNKLKNDCHFVITTPSKLQSESGEEFLELLKVKSFNTIILDEAQRYHENEKGTKQTYDFLTNFIKPFKLAQNPPLVVLASGTPFEKSEDDVWSLLMLVNPDLFDQKSFERLIIKENLILKKIKNMMNNAFEFSDVDLLYGQVIDYLSQYNGAKRIISALLRIRHRSDSDIIRQWREKGCGMPQPVYKKIKYHLTSEQLTLLGDSVNDLTIKERWNIRNAIFHPKLFDENFLSELKDLQKRNLTKKGIKYLSTKSSGLLSHLINENSELALAIQNKEPSLIFVEGISEGRILRRALKFHFAKYDPQISFYFAEKAKKKKEFIIAKFKKPTNKPRILITTYQSGGVGFDFTDVQNLFNLTSVYNPSDINQMEARALRMNSKHAKVNIWRYQAKGLALAKHIERILKRKEIHEKFFLTFFEHLSRKDILEFLKLYHKLLTVRMLSVAKLKGNKEKSLEVETNLNSIFKLIFQKAETDSMIEVQFKLMDSLYISNSVITLDNQKVTEVMSDGDEEMRSVSSIQSPIVRIPSLPLPIQYLDLDKFINNYREITPLEVQFKGVNYKTLPIQEGSLTKAIHFGAILAKDTGSDDIHRSLKKIFDFLHKFPDYFENFQKSESSSSEDYIKFEELLTKFQKTLWTEDEALYFCNKKGHRIDIFEKDLEGKVQVTKGFNSVKSFEKKRRTIRLFVSKFNGKNYYSLLIHKGGITTEPLRSQRV